MARESKAEQLYRQLVQDRMRALIDAGVVAHHDEEGKDYLYRPGQVLVAAEALAGLADVLGSLGAGEPDHEEELGLARVPLPAGVDVHEAVLELRQAGRLDAAAVGPHHVLFGAPKWGACPGRPPFPAPPIVLQTGPSEPEAEGDPAGTGVLIAVIDTGQAASSLLGAWESTHVQVGPGDLDLLDLDADGLLDLEAGHGTFITGVIAQVAPGADVLVLAALTPSGVTDDVTAARAVLRARAAGAAIINLSFGGYAEGDVVPLALRRALGIDKAAADPDADPVAGTAKPFVVVAAAGNDGTSRRFFPAALPGVIAVAALNHSGRRAGFSNFGPWVDACADGDRLVSTFVTGEVLTDSDGDGRRDVFEDPYAYWSGTSFAAPQVAAALAGQMSTAGQSAADAAATLVHGPTLTRRPGLGTRVVTSVRSHQSGPGRP
jgi:hypothetical protein